MSNEKYDTAVAGLALAALDGAQMMIESLRKDKEHVSTELAAARREIASLRERVQMLGQLARDVNSRRVLELEAQLEAVQEGRDIQGDIDRYNENTMTDTKQPEALRLADAMERFTKSSHWWTDGEPIHIAVAAELRRLQSENEQLRAGYAQARREIATLQAQAQQCGAGAGCCAQAARIAELEAQLEAVATPAQPLHVAAINCPHEIDKDRVVLHFDSKQPGKNALAQLAARLQAAQAQDARQPVVQDGAAPGAAGKQQVGGG